MPQVGPITMWLNSTTRMPASGKLAGAAAAGPRAGSWLGTLMAKPLESSSISYYFVTNQ